MAQSNHCRPDSPAGAVERAEQRNCCSARHPLLDPRRRPRATQPPVFAADDPSFVRVRARVRQVCA